MSRLFRCAIVVVMILLRVLLKVLKWFIWVIVKCRVLDRLRLRRRLIGVVMLLVFGIRRLDRLNVLCGCNGVMRLTVGRRSLLAVFEGGELF